MNITERLQQHANPEKARFLQGFFKTGPGQYAEGDILLGISVPDQRKIARDYTDLPLTALKNLLHSPIHEYRLTALVILTNQFGKYQARQKAIFDFYLKNTKYINNWDLVDISAHKIIGEYLLDKDWSILKKMASTGHLWEKRIAMVATLTFLNRKNPAPTMQIAEILLADKHDLLQKATGWMLREMGKKLGEGSLLGFLDAHHKTMGRTALRYAIERLTPEQKRYYMGR